MFITDRNIIVKNKYSCRAFAGVTQAYDNAAMNLKSMRLSRGLSQKELADMAGVQQATISKVEAGYDGVTLRVLRSLAAALDVEVYDLLSDDRAAAERELVKAFRALSADRQQGWLELAAALVQPGSQP